MPCDSGPLTAADFGVPQLRTTVRRTKMELDRVTRLLCLLCLRVQETNPRLLHGMIAEWWTVHKKQDAVRAARQRVALRRRQRETEARQRRATLKAQAVRKLTKAELRALMGH